MTKYYQIGEIFLNRPDLTDPDQKLAAAYEFPRTLAQDLGIPRLGTFGMTRSDIPAMVALAQKSSSMKYNPIPLDVESLNGILLAAL